MSKSAEIALGAALVAALATSTMAQSKKESPRNYGIGTCRHGGADGRLGYRRAARWAGRACGQRIGESR